MNDSFELFFMRTDNHRSPNPNKFHDMRNICFCFQVHQPLRLRRYRFFDIGNDHYYYDDYTNESVMRKVVAKSYLPTNELLLKLIHKHKGKFKVSFSISGVALEQFRLYAPEVLESFQQLAQTGQVEFLAETWAHSLVALKDPNEFKRQVELHANTIEELFGQKPTAFRNTEMIYSDLLGEMVASMGYKVMLTEGAKHILGWKSPNYLYCNAINPRLKVLLRNYVLSDDIAFRFSNQNWSQWPLTADKYVDWLNQIDGKDEVVNLFMDYETFGEHQWRETGIFDFLGALPGAVLKKSNFQFATPSEIADKLQPVSPIHVPNPISWADEERDLTAWLGNEMQQEAFNKMYALLPKVNKCQDPKLMKDWLYLQTSDHLYYMCTKYFSDGAVHSYFNPYETPYEAFINYMNALSDFSIRIHAAVPENNQDVELANLSKLLEKKDEKIMKLEAELKKMREKKSKPAAKAEKSNV